MTEYFDYANQEEETTYERLVEQGKLPGEARAEILSARKNTLGHEAVIGTTLDSHEQKKTPHYSRRGGRSYPEPSDSELDPNWNVAGSVRPMDETEKASFDEFRNGTVEAAKRSMARNGISAVQADAIMVARSQRH